MSTGSLLTHTLCLLVLVMVTMQLSQAWMLQPRRLTQSASSSIHGIHRSSSNIHSSRSVATTLAQTPSDSTENTAEPAPPTDQKGRIVVIEVPLGDGFGPVKIQFRPIFAKSTFYVTSYDVPFGLNIDKPPAGFPAPIVKKAGELGLSHLCRCHTRHVNGFLSCPAYVITCLPHSFTF